MSDGLRRVAGASTPVVIAGKTYSLSPLTLGVQADLEARVVARRAHTLEQAAGSLGSIPAVHWQAVLTAALKLQIAVASQEECDEYTNTSEGMCYLIWLRLKRNHPEIDSLVKATALCEQEELEYIERRLAQAEEDLKNSAGPVVEAGPPVKVMPVSQPELPGPASTAS